VNSTTYRKDTDEVVPRHAIEAYEVGRTSPPILNLGTKQKLVVCFTLRSLYSRIDFTGRWANPRAGLKILEIRNTY